MCTGHLLGADLELASGVPIAAGSCPGHHPRQLGHHLQSEAQPAIRWMLSG